MVDHYMLNGVIDGSGLSREYIAGRMNISRQSLYNKLKGDTEFTASEISTLKDVLGLSQAQVRRIFFAKESECNSHTA